VLLTANCAKVAESSASQKLQLCVKFEITWKFSAKNLTYVSVPSMAYRFSAKDIATEIARIRQIVSFRQVSTVRVFHYCLNFARIVCVNFLSQYMTRPRLLIFWTADCRKFVA
jgi:hypothetical protein